MGGKCWRWRREAKLCHLGGSEVKWARGNELEFLGHNEGLLIVAKIDAYSPKSIFTSSMADK